MSASAASSLRASVSRIWRNSTRSAGLNSTQSCLPSARAVESSKRHHALVAAAGPARIHPAGGSPRSSARYGCSGAGQLPRNGASRSSARSTAASMSASTVPVHEYEKKTSAAPTSPEVSTSSRSPTSTTLSASERPVEAVSAQMLAANPDSLHTSAIDLVSADRSE
eukprot:4979144-Prymnesium_polylepis.2